MVWNGNDLWLAGFNNQGAAGNVAIIKVSNALATSCFHFCAILRNEMLGCHLCAALTT